MKHSLSSILLVYLVTVSITFAQHGVGNGWGPEVILPLKNSGAKQRGVLYNNIVTTSDGRIIISTSEVNSSNVNQTLGHYLTYSDDGGTNWLNPPQQFTPTNLVIGGGGVKLAMDSKDTLYVLWTGKNPSAIFISKLDKNLNIIKDSIRVASQVTNYTNTGFATHFTIDRYNRIHVMWHEGNPGSSQKAESFYTRSTDGGLTWSPVDTLSSIDGHHSAFPHAEFDFAGDTLAIAWRDSVDGTKKWDVYGVVSTNGGQTWSNPDTLISTNDADWDPDLLVDNQGRFHLAYHVYPTGNAFWGARVEYRYSDNLGSTWMTPTNPSSGQISEPGKRSQLVECFRYDAIRNVLWFSWKDERDFNTSTGDAQGDLMITYSTDRGLTWSTPEFATDLHDSTTGFKAGTLLPNGDYCLNYEVISPGDINSTGFLRVYFRKRNSLISNIDLVVSHRWNMLSVPLTVSDYRKSTLFPTAVSPAFAFQGTYVQKDTLTNGVGYWLKFDSAQTVSMAGQMRTTDSIDVQPGWNLIGSISQPVPVSTITSNPPGLVTSQFFGYDGGYVTADSILPGKAYWVKVSEGGMLILSFSGGASRQ